MKEFNSIEEMYEEYYSKIYNFIFYKTLNKEITEDIVSEVFLKVIYKLKTYKSEKSCFSTWIFTIAKNTLIDYYRKNHFCENIEDYSKAMIYLKDDFEDINNETEKKLLQGLSFLNDSERTLFFYKYYMELTNREIASKINMNESTVSTKIQRGREKIKKKMNFE